MMQSPSATASAVEDLPSISRVRITNAIEAIALRLYSCFVTTVTSKQQA